MVLDAQASPSRVCVVCVCPSEPRMDSWLSEQDESGPPATQAAQICSSLRGQPSSSGPREAAGRAAPRPAASRSITSASLSYLETPNCTVAGQ